MLKQNLHLPTRFRKNRDEKPKKESKGNILRRKILHTYPKFLRSLFEKNRIKKILGTNLAVMVFASNLIPVSSKAVNDNVQDIIVTPIVLTTEKSIQSPLASISITQGYKFYHPGTDFDGETGDKIYPVMRGNVIEAGKSKIGYGNYVLVSHHNGYKTLYAHLSKINVSVDQVVELSTVIGLMGSTGHSSGSHLHLEVYENEKRVNPLTVIPMPSSSPLASKL